MPPRILHYSDIESAYDDPGRIGRLAGLINELRGEDTFVVGTGDNTAPGVLAMVTEAEQALDFFRAVSPDAETFGNHDFDFGHERTRELVRESPQTWVCANLYGENGRFGASEGVLPWTVLEANGSHVGIFGVIDPATPSMTSLPESFAITDPVAAAEEAVSDLRDRNVDHVVALSHVGSGDDALAAGVDIDAILGGHVHTERIEHVDNTLLTRPGANGHALLEITLGNSASATRHAVADAPLDTTVRDALEARMDDAGLNEVVAHVAERIEWTGQSVYEGECRIGNFVADAYRWAGDADVGLQNSGSIRAGRPLDGNVTVGDLASAVPFGAPLVVASVTGDELRELFRQGDSALVEFGDDRRWYAHISGARIVYDHGERELVEATVGGEPIDSERAYSVATSAFVCSTDIEFLVLTPSHRERTLDIQYEVLAAYAREKGLDPRVDGRVTQHNVRE